MKHQFLTRLSLIVFLSVNYAYSMEQPEAKEKVQFLKKKIHELYSQSFLMGYLKVLVDQAEKQAKLYNEVKQSEFFPTSTRVSKFFEEEYGLQVPITLSSLSTEDIGIVMHFHYTHRGTIESEDWLGFYMYEKFQSLADQVKDKKLKSYIENLISYNSTAPFYLLLDNVIKKTNQELFFAGLANQLPFARQASQVIESWLKARFSPASPRANESEAFSQAKKLLESYEKNRLQNERVYGLYYAQLAKFLSKKSLQTTPATLPTPDEFAKRLRKDISVYREDLRKKERECLSEEEQMMLKKREQEEIAKTFLPKKILETEKKKKQQAQKLKKQKKKKAQQVQKKEAEYLVGIKEKKAREAELKKESKEEEPEEKKITPEKKEFDEVNFYNKKYASIDKSKVIEITDRAIKIDDPRNNAIITLIKVKDAQRIAPKRLKRAKRVQLWFDNSIQALVERGELDDQMKRKELPWELEYNIRRHAFADMVDAFVERYGVDSEYIDERGEAIPNKVIPGEIQFIDKIDLKTNKPLRINGLFAYGKLPKADEWYHRFFTRKPFNDQLEEFMRTGKWVVKEGSNE